MKLIGNIIWLIFGGLELALGWIAAGILLCVTVIGIPAGMQAFKMASLALFPFGKNVDSGGGAGSCLLNILWLILGGAVLALVHAAIGLVFCITIIGMPFGMQHFKLAKLALMPFGAVVS